MCSQASAESKKIVGVFYKANEYASLNPNFVGSLEGALGIRDWLESQGHQYIVTDDKEGLDSGECVCVLHTISLRALILRVWLYINRSKPAKLVLLSI